MCLGVRARACARGVRGVAECAECGEWGVARRWRLDEAKRCPGARARARERERERERERDRGGGAHEWRLLSSSFACNVKRLIIRVKRSHLTRTRALIVMLIIVVIVVIVVIYQVVEFQEALTPVFQPGRQAA